MESMELGALMLCTCIWGTLTYSDGSPLRSLGLSAVSNSTLMGTAVAVTTFIIIRSPFGRRSGAHMNPSVTLTFLWLGRIHRWDAAWYVRAQFIGATAGVLAAREICLFRPLLGDRAGSTWKRNHFRRRILALRDSYGGHTLLVESPAVSAFYSNFGSRSDDPFFRTLTLEIWFQR